MPIYMPIHTIACEWHYMYRYTCACCHPLMQLFFESTSRNKILKANTKLVDTVCDLYMCIYMHAWPVTCVYTCVYTCKSYDIVRSTHCWCIHRMELKINVTIYIECLCTHWYSCVVYVQVPLSGVPWNLFSVQEAASQGYQSRRSGHC